MALLGSSIDPRLFQQDYSGYVRAGEMQAQGVANLAQSIGGAIKDFAEEKKRINQDIAKGKSALQFAKANYPELADRIDEIGKIFSDVNVSKAEQAAAGSQMGDFVTAMIRGQEFNTEVDLKKRALDIQEAEALARNEPKPVVYDFEPVEIPAEYGGQPGVLRADKDPRSGIIRASDGKLYRNEEDFKLQRNPIIQSNIDAGLNTGIPLTASDIERRAIEINNALEIPDSNNAVEANPILLNDFPDGMPVATETPAPLGAPTMTKPPVIDALPPGFVPKQVEQEKPIVTSRIVTGEEAERLGGDPNKKYVIREAGQEVTDISVLPPDITPAEERERAKDEAAKIETQRAGELAVKSINKFIDDSGNSNESLKRAVGYGEEIATGIAKIAPFLGTQSPQDRTNQKELAILVEKGLLDAASELKPVSNVDLQLLKRNRPEISDPPELWASWLKDVRNILGDPNSYKEGGGKSGTGASLEDQLNSLIIGGEQ